LVNFAQKDQFLSRQKMTENLLKQHKSEKGAPAGNGGVEKFKRTFF
jgi:hypothetical protein